MTTTVTTRTVKGSELTWAELDTNFTSLASAVNSAAKVETNPATGGVTFSAGDKSLQVVDYPYWPIQAAAPAGASTTVNGSESGIGDVLGKVDYVVNATGATATLSVQDATGTTYALNPTGGFLTTGAGSVALGYTSVTGAWKVICGAGLSAVANLL